MFVDFLEGHTKGCTSDTVNTTLFTPFEIHQSCSFTLKYFTRPLRSNFGLILSALDTTVSPLSVM